VTLESETGYGRPFTIPLELGKLREFATATKARSTYWFDEPNATIPPTFLATMLFWAHEDSLPYIQQGFAAERVLHGGREYTFHGEPPRIGDVLTARQRIEETYTKEGRRGGPMRFVIALTEFLDESGTVVVEMRNTTIETGRPATEES
jgi:hypothetical protein